MKYLTNLVFSMVLLMLFTSSLAAQEIEIGGKYRGEFEAVEQDSSYDHQHWMNLILEKEFGASANMHLNLEFNTYDGNNVIPLIQEAYVNYYTDYVDWRFGKQIISWGSSYEIKPTDYFNPYDLTTINPFEKRLGVIGAQGTYYGPARTEISLVYTPFFKEHLIPGKAQSMLMDAAIRGTIGQLNAATPPMVRIISDPGTPVVYPEVERTIENTQGGLKLTKRGLLGLDISVSAYHGRDKLPAVNQKKTRNSIFLSTMDPAELDTLATVYIENPEVTRVGLDLIGSFGGMGVWAEGVHNFYRPGYLDNSNSIVFGADYKFSNNLYLVGQGLYFQGRSDSEKNINAVMFHASKPALSFHEFELTMLYEFESDSYFIQPQFNYSLSNAVELQFGGTLHDLQGIQYAQLSSMLIRERLYARISVDF